MKYELIHDTIARQIYEKASVEARTRRKVEKHIRERYEAFQLRNAKLTQDDWDYIIPYLQEVNISREEAQFVERGRRMLSAAKNRRLWMAIGVIAALSILLGISVWAGYQANIQRDRAIESEQAALKSEHVALQSEMAAQDSARVAKEQRRLAEQKTQEAEASRRAALDSALVAQLQRKLAEQKTKEAEESDSLKQIALEEALTAKDLALQQATIAQAIALAAKSRQLITTDTALALNLAFAAFYTYRSQETVSGFHDIYLQANPQNLLLRSFKAHKKAIKSIAFSPACPLNHDDCVYGNGKQALTGSLDDTAKLWDVQTGKEIRRFRGHESFVYAVAFAPPCVVIGGNCTKPQRRNILTGSADHSAKLWDADTGEEMMSFEGHTAPVTSLAFSPDGTFILTGSGDQNVKLWEVQSGKELITFTGHTGSVSSVAFSPRGKYVLTGSADHSLKLWNAASGDTIRTFQGHEDDVYAVAFSPDGKQILSGSFDQSARLWDVKTGETLQRFEGHEGPIGAVAFAPACNSNSGTCEVDHSQQVLTASWDQSAILWDIGTGKEILSFKGHEASVSSIAFSPVCQDNLDACPFQGKRQIMTASADGTVKLWDASLQWNEKIYRLNAEEKKVYGIKVDY